MSIERWVHFRAGTVEGFGAWVTHRIGSGGRDRAAVPTTCDDDPSAQINHLCAVDPRTPSPRGDICRGPRIPTNLYRAIPATAVEFCRGRVDSRDGASPIHFPGRTYRRARILSAAIRAPLSKHPVSNRVRQAAIPPTAATAQIAAAPPTPVPQSHRERSKAAHPPECASKQYCNQPNQRGEPYCSTASVSQSPISESQTAE